MFSVSAAVRCSVITKLHARRRIKRTQKSDGISALERNCPPLSSAIISACYDACYDVKLRMKEKGTREDGKWDRFIFFKYTLKYCRHDRCSTQTHFSMMRNFNPIEIADRINWLPKRTRSRLCQLSTNSVTLFTGTLYKRRALALKWFSISLIPSMRPDVTWFRYSAQIPCNEPAGGIGV